MSMADPVILVTVLYPLLTQVWVKEPFNAKNLAVPSSPSYLEEQVIREQIDYYRKIKDSRLRRQIIKPLAAANHPEAVFALENMLASESDSKVTGDLLVALAQYRDKKKISKPSLLKKHFSSPDAKIRGYAMMLYFDKSGDAATVLKQLRTEESAFVNNLVWSALAGNAGKCGASDVKSFLDSKNPVVKAGAIKVLASQSQNPDTETELAKLPESANALDRIALAEALKNRKTGGDKLLGKLADDKNRSVRSLVAEAKPAPARKKIILKLLKDKDWEVRRAAALTLGGYNSDDVVKALTDSLKDQERPVREAAVVSLLLIKPGAGAISDLQDLLDNPNARKSAVELLGKLGAKSAALKILQVLEEASGSETVVEAIMALGRLDHKPAWQKILDKSGDSSPEVRIAVAEALAMLKMKQSFKPLAKMFSDKNTDVAVAAIAGAGKIGNPGFNRALYRSLASNRDMASRQRAAAAWGLARTGKPNSAIIRRLKQICLEKIITVEGEKMHDGDYVRAAACFALVDLGKNNPSAASAADEVIKAVSEAPPENDLANTTLKEFVRQMDEYRKNGKTEAHPVPVTKPVLKVSRIQESN